MSRTDDSFLAPLSVRLTVDQRIRLQHAAGLAGMTMTNYVRQLADALPAAPEETSAPRPPRRSPSNAFW